MLKVTLSMKHTHNTVRCYMVTGLNTRIERHPGKCNITKKRKEQKEQFSVCLQLWGVITPAAYVANEYLII